jgi:3-hydroxymyristoyl/3-hydroxydecanoyl-(acyl carrier protein) dehydratase
VAGADGLAALLRLVAQLIAARVSVDLDVLQGRRAAPLPLTPRPPLPQRGEGEQERAPVSRDAERIAQDDPLAGQLAQLTATLEARGEAHAAYFRLAQSLQSSAADVLALQGQLFEQVLSGAPLSPPGEIRPALKGRPSEGSRVNPAEDKGAPRDVASGQPGSPGLFVEAGPSGPDGSRRRDAVFLDRRQCLTFAVGKIGDVLGSDFAPIDAFPTRVRLPDEPLMLVDRILAVEAVPLSMTHGRVVTEHDVLPGAWYLDAGRIPTSIAIESGQADLFLSGYLGIDFRTRGRAVYRLLDASATFHRPLPCTGSTIRYDIHVDNFFRQGETHLFRFRFVGTVDGEPLLTMSDGVAGFFTEEELLAGRGVVQTALRTRPRPGVRPDDSSILPPVGVESYSEAQVDALRVGDLAGCFGSTFDRLPLRQPMRLPGGRMRLVHRVTHIDPDGGRYGTGLIRAEADVHPDDWFLTCHFIDDQVMPGTLMYECCLHTLRIFLMRLGWVGEHEEVVAEPKPGVTSRLKCRGQVTASTKVVTYEVIVRERGYDPAPYAVVDALMYADGKAIVDITDMSVRLSGLTREDVAALWLDQASGGREPPESAAPLAAPPTQGADAPRSPAPLFDRHHILAFATGKPSEAFGDRYLPFDRDRFIARLPAPPFSFLDRIVELDAQPWQMVAGGRVVAEYDVPPDAWYFAGERGDVMPFTVLLEAALQACGWMAAFMGSALRSEDDLHFRNLGGGATLRRCATRDSGTLRTTVKVKNVSSSGGMIIQDYEFATTDRHGPLYEATTTFGFFTAKALAQQVGVRDAKPYEPTPDERRRAENFAYPEEAPFPDAKLRMLDRVERLVLDGGPVGLGFVEGTKDVRPGEWFFAAHFVGDPVWPGSLGLEAMLQLLKVIAARRWPAVAFEANLGRHRWTYRGQVVPTNKVVRVQAVVTAIDEAQHELTADGHLSVDGLMIYRMNDFRLRARP